MSGLWLVTLLLLPLPALAGKPKDAAPPAPAAPAAPAPVPAASALERMRALAGDWVDADGNLGVPPGTVVASYRVTGNGSAVVETLFPGSPHEMMTVYHVDGTDLVLTHYCAVGNQPRMRAKTLDGNVLEFAFDGGTNFDPAKDMHMHDARIELVGPAELRGEWRSWEGGKPAEHVARFHVVRKAG